MILLWKRAVSRSPAPARNGCRDRVDSVEFTEIKLILTLYVLRILYYTRVKSSTTDSETRSTPAAIPQTIDAGFGATTTAAAA